MSKRIQYGLGLAHVFLVLDCGDVLVVSGSFSYPHGTVVHGGVVRDDYLQSVEWIVTLVDAADRVVDRDSLVVAGEEDTYGWNIRVILVHANIRVSDS